MESTHHSLKVAGISGVGKTTLIKAVLAKYGCIEHLCYSQYLAEFGDQAETQMTTTLHASHNLVLMDEHLEIGDHDLVRTYLDENTIGIFVLEADVAEVVLRRHRDQGRVRAERPEDTETSQARARSRARHLASRLSIPIAIMRNGSPEKNLEALVLFIKLAGISL